MISLQGHTVSLLSITIHAILELATYAIHINKRLGILVLVITKTIIAILCQGKLKYIFRRMYKPIHGTCVPRTVDINAIIILRCAYL